MTPYTSYLATDGSERKELAGRRLDQLPLKARAPAANMSVDITSSGAGAVAASKSARDQREKVQLDGQDKDETLKAGTVKKLGVKTFYLENGVWVDSEFKEEAKLTETRIAFASDAYFDLAMKEKEIGQYLALGEQVVIVWKGKVYRITK